MRKLWERMGYYVEEISPGQFHVVKNGDVVATISADGSEDRNRIIADLDAGEDVNGWEDGAGNTIYVEIDKVEVVYGSGQSRYSEESIDYMLARYDGKELYAEMRNDSQDETETYEPLKKEIIEQAKEKGINPKHLIFYYDE